MIKVNANSAFLTLGTLGALCILFGYFQMPPQKYYIIGAIALLLTAIHFKLIYFIALECIVVAGNIANFLHISIYAQVGLPILLTLQLLIFYTMLGKQNNIILLIGIIGIALLSLGFTNQNLWVFCSGSTAVGLYSFYHALRGNVPCYIWAGLNSILTAITLYQLAS